MIVQPITSIADGIGRALAALCAVGAAYAFIAAFALDVAPEAGWLALWQKWGFAMFAGLFALLALRPRASAGLWELAFFHKAIIGLAGLTSPFIPGAVQAGMIDFVLALILALAYVLTRGWTAWQAR